jgi:hypothetical protein
MSEGSMTDRPYGGVNKRPDDDVLPGERPDDDGKEGPPPPAQFPRAAQEEMSEDVTEVPDTGRGTKPPGMPDPTGPTG